MKINIDLQCVNIQGTGIAEYARSRIEYLQKRSGFSLYGYVSKMRHNHELDFFKTYEFPIKMGRIPIRLLYSHSLYNPLPISYEWLSGSKADVNLYFTWNIKRVKHYGITIATIHDLIALRTEMENQQIVDDQRNDLGFTIRNCDYIITVSEASKNDIICEFDYPADKIKVVPNGIDFKHFNKKVSEEKLSHIRQKYNLPEKFILYLGGMRKHKNIERLIEAYALLPIDVKKKYKLVITKGTPALKELVLKKHLESYVFFISFVNEEDKVGLYQLASLYAYVSLYEGFGLPVIEAQAAGTPVLTSNVSSLPEIAGDSALCVTPTNVSEISEGLKAILTNEELRRKLIEKGYKNASVYSNENAGKILCEFLQSVVKK